MEEACLSSEGVRLALLVLIPSDGAALPSMFVVISCRVWDCIVKDKIEFEPGIGGREARLR